MSERRNPRPRRDGSGRGVRANRGRQCDDPKDLGIGQFGRGFRSYWRRWRDALLSD